MGLVLLAGCEHKIPLSTAKQPETNTGLVRPGQTPAPTAPGALASTPSPTSTPDIKTGSSTAGTPVVRFTPGTGTACDSQWASLLSQSGSEPSLGTSNDFLTAVNTYRQTKSLAPLQLSSKLGHAARIHSLDMAARKYLDHTTPASNSQGCSFEQRLTVFALVAATSLAENIAVGQTSVDDVLKAWKSDPEHDANLLSPSANFMGIDAEDASASGYPGFYWTLDLAQMDPAVAN